MIVPYLVASANDEQKQRWFPGLCCGETIAAIAMSEPGAGSDLQGIRTSAVDVGDHYVLKGQKTFISNGILADLVVVVARTDPEAGHQGISACSSSSAAWRASSAAATSTRSASTPRTPPSCSSTTSGCPKANLLGEEGAGLPLPDDQPVAGAPLDRGLRGDGVRADPRADA